MRVFTSKASFLAAEWLRRRNSWGGSGVIIGDESSMEDEAMSTGLTIGLLLLALLLVSVVGRADTQDR